MRTLHKFLGWSALTVVGLFLIAEFSNVKTRYECDGVVETLWQDDKRPAKIFIKLEEYSLLVGLWRDSAGSLHIEIPGEIGDHSLHAEKVRDVLIFYNSDKTTKGNFSNLSKALFIGLHGKEEFQGYCKVIPK